MTEYTPGDPKPPVKAALLALFAGDAGPRPRVAMDVPTDWDLKSGIPLVTVHDDGGPLQYPILSHHTIRVTVRANGNPLARSIANRASGNLHNHLPAGLEKVRLNGTALTEARDTDTGADLASFTVTATVRTAISA